MLESVMIYVYLVLVGLVAGGVTVSGYRLVTNAQPSFQARPTTATGASARFSCSCSAGRWC